MRAHGYRVTRFDCARWRSEEDLHAALKEGLELPAYTGSGFDALADSLTDIEVPEGSGVLVALDNFSDAHGGDVLLEVLASASWWWLLFGRVFCVVLRTDDPQYEGPVVGGAPPRWNGREWLDAHRGL
jgi:RNAse (barnase) inhibitor barstar